MGTQMGKRTKVKAGMFLEQSVFKKPFADSLALPFRLLSDFPKLNVIRSYGGLSGELPLMIARRWLFPTDLRISLRADGRRIVRWFSPKRF
jgi:peroxiredoxin